MTSFSRRHGYSGQPAPITVREDAPLDLRSAVVPIAVEEGFPDVPSEQRELICRVLREMPDQGNWSEYPNIAGEVASRMRNCKWYHVYDIAEAFYAALPEPQRKSKVPDLDFLKDLSPQRGATEFESKLNEVLCEHGIGWKMELGQILYRGELPFEQAVAAAQHALDDSKRGTSRNEIAEALKDLSRRPEPDRTGAIQHSMAALECVARDISGDPKKTLGQILKDDTLSIPRPLDSAVERVWGYASEVGRHLQEGREPAAEEAELVTTLCAAVVTYLVKKHDRGRQA